MKHVAIIAVAFGLGLIPNESFAGGCGCVPISLPVGEQFTTHRAGDFRIGYAMTYSDTDHYFIGTERQDGPGQTEETVAPATLGFDNVFSLEYDFEHDLTVGVEVPIVHTEQSREFGGVQGSMDASGLGDVRLLGRYWFRNNPYGFTFQGGLGVRLPTGESDRTFRAQNGTMVTQDLAAQAGTGNAAGVVEFRGSTFFAHRYGFAFATRYTFTPSSTTVNNFRNELTGNGFEKNSDADALTSRVSLGTPFSTGEGFPSRMTGRANVDLAWVPYEDLLGESEGFRRAGVILAIGPEVSFAATDTFAFSAGVPLTVYRNVQRNGGNVQEWAFQFGISFDSALL
jgi:hypothetical protein